MKCTPANRIIEAVVFSACWARAEAVADVIGHVLDIGILVIVGEEDGILLLLQPGDLREQVQSRIHLPVQPALPVNGTDLLGGKQCVGHDGWGRKPLVQRSGISE